ncbi:Sigma-70, region 4 [Mucilaginibacter mallensis]|uniref:Sigma-70, region 4 n=1 Tax=Mucilaginibacter mallensis TaxID=652787 RepID=A0A1H1VL69_MUCMA|nr:sigma factor-like helix-turn-helix DNA-binding protein [Mucilaginibacter mallensis]SDS85280.1 Sigma-70, region 4 [Mucilaginibacter mallensis]
MKTEKQISINLYQYNVRELYDRYSGMLFGYIYEIVKDNKLAEQHLINIYNFIPDHINELADEGTNTWGQLQQLAKKYLEYSIGTIHSSQFNGADLSKYNGRNRFLGLMTHEQRHVFYNAYYCGKTIAELSEELNKSEEMIRMALKEAFIIIKKG